MKQHFASPINFDASLSHLPQSMAPTTVNPMAVIPFRDADDLRHNAFNAIIDSVAIFLISVASAFNFVVYVGLKTRLRNTFAKMVLTLCW